MQIAVFSDVHGNPFALNAVLAAIEQEGEFDHIVVAGDLAFGGSNPAYCIDRIREADLLAVYGNTEVYIHSPHDVPGDLLHLKKWDRLQTDAAWVREKIGPERITWLANLPFDLNFSPTNDPRDDLLVFHANPISVEEMIYPSPDDQVALIGEVLQPDNDPELEKLFDGVRARTVAFGHYHFTSERRIRNRVLVNVAPVSMPAKDHDPRARYTVFQWADSDWKISRRLIDYDYTQEISALEKCGIPHWRDHAATFPG